MTAGPRRERELAVVAADAAGIDPTDFGKFTSDRHPDVVAPSRFDLAGSTPVLIRLLPSLDDPGVREMVVRSLSTSAARPSATPVLIEEFLRTSDASDPSLKWAIGNALDTTADQDAVAVLMDLAGDTANGRGRQMIVTRLGRSAKSEVVVGLLIELLDDPDVTLHAMGALRQQLGARQARPFIEQRTHSDSPHVRAAASRQLRRIDRSLTHAGPEQRRSL